MKGQISSHRIVLILLIVGFTVVSAFGCFAIVGRYLIDQDLIVAGDTFVEETKSNSLVAIVICSVIQVVALFSEKKGARVAGLVASTVAVLLTTIYAPLCNAGKQLMGGIISYHCEITWVGYIAIVLSFTILLLHIYSLKKQG